MRKILSIITFSLLLSLLSTTLFAQIILHDFEFDDEDSFVPSIYISVKTDYINCQLEIYEHRELIKTFKKINVLKDRTNRFNLPFIHSRKITPIIKDCQHIRPLKDTKALPFFKSEIDLILKQGFSYLKSSQIKESATDGSRFKGEWGSSMEVRKSFKILLAKKGDKAWDSNCFTTSSIFNSLATIYLKYGRNNDILEMLQLALTDVMACEENGSFNFWHWIDLPTRFQIAGKLNRTRGPNNFKYKKRLFYMFSNVVNDSDDTSTAYTALKLAQKIQEISPNFVVPKLPKEKIGDIFSSHIDKNRYVLNLYDLVTFRPRRTGAFLTWLCHNEFPIPYFPSMKKQNIPLRTNDVDCVVNSNILAALSLYRELDSTRGAKDSCHYLNKQIRKKNFNKCALYYPNKFSLPYVMSKAISHGVSCLEKSRNILIKKVLLRQESDGSWDSFKEHDDMVQSSIYAIHTLLNLYDGSDKLKSSINRGMRFILSQKISFKTMTFWKGGIYFSGGTFAKRRIVWKSDSYTTVLILEALAHMKKLNIVKGN